MKVTRERKSKLGRSKTEAAGEARKAEIAEAVKAAAKSGQMMSIEEVCSFVGGAGRPLDRSTIYRWIRRGQFPKAISLSHKTKRWRRTDCEKAIAAFIAASDLPPPTHP